jgi:hypothetical protein
MGLFSGLGNLLKGQTSGKNIAQNLLTGGVSTAHDFNKDGYHRLFPDAVSPPDAPPAPTIDAADASAQDKEEQLRRRRGMAATILGGLEAMQPTTQATSLLGN